YHLKASGEMSWHLMPRVIEAIDRARAEGVDITADMYPYVASGTGLNVLIPQWAHEGERLFENLRDPKTRAIIRAEMLDPPIDTPGLARTRNRAGIVPVGLRKPENRQFVGKNLDEIAAMRGQ